MLEIPAFLVFLQCIMVWLGAIYKILKILNSDFLSFVRVLQLVPGCWKWMNFVPFSENLGCSWAQWMNEFWIVEFHVFPVKDNHYELRGLLWNYNIMGCME